MNRNDLVKEARKVIPDPASAKNAVDSLIANIRTALQNGESVTLSGFGTFKPVVRQARTGRNPRTGEAIAIPARQTVKFLPGKALREEIAG